ncbi:MAG: hypothetical protein MK105_10350 [Crocinitomicaceae bacterium]|nr:hypothetical protein [Crocinitomicaceae bacterium]
MKQYLIIALGCILMSCGTTKDLATEETEIVKDTISNGSEDDQQKTKSIKDMKIKAQIGEMKDGDAFNIEGVRISGNTMYVDVSYGGGCGDHSFEMNGSMAVMKSFPPQRAVKITHKNHKDYCKAIVTKTLEIDISELSDGKTKGSTIILLLDGWDERIKYTFE